MMVAIGCGRRHHRGSVADAAHVHLDGSQGEIDTRLGVFLVLVAVYFLVISLAHDDFAQGHRPKFWNHQDVAVRSHSRNWDFADALHQGAYDSRLVVLPHAFSALANELTDIDESLIVAVLQLFGKPVGFCDLLGLALDRLQEGEVAQVRSIASGPGATDREIEIQLNRKSTHLEISELRSDKSHLRKMAVHVGMVG